MIVLKVHLFEARDLKKPNLFFNKFNVNVILYIGNTRFISNYIKNTCNPKFNQSFSFNILNEDSCLLNIEVWNKGNLVTKNKCIGKTNFLIKNLLSYEDKNKIIYVDLMGKHGYHGHVKLCLSSAYADNIYNNNYNNYYNNYNNYNTTYNNNYCNNSINYTSSDNENVKIYYNRENINCKTIQYLEDNINNENCNTNNLKTDCNDNNNNNYNDTQEINETSE